ncbi:MAG: ASPIC/UnbV domain-containing protein [Candidatus Poribacteria bacterium]|nr:ASPIC/UnbV domain-containing protein [Candidatus Poribacteria bacterium]
MSDTVQKSNIPFKKVKSGSGYLSQNDMRLHFRLGDVKQVDSVTVRWVNGHVETFKKVDTNQALVIEEKR